MLTARQALKNGSSVAAAARVQLRPGPSESPETRLKMGKPVAAAVRVQPLPLPHLMEQWLFREVLIHPGKSVHMHARTHTHTRARTHTHTHTHTCTHKANT